MSSLQARFAQALLDPELAPPVELRAWNGSDPAARLAVYRNNVTVSLVDALACTFPVCLTLVGEPFFRAMARVFVRQQPPTERSLNRYGTCLPEFIERFEPAAALPYLADVARLELLRLQSLHAADDLPMDLEALAQALNDGDTLAHLRWRLHASLRVLDARHAAVSIWLAHQQGSGVALQDVDTRQPEAALCLRHEDEVRLHRVSRGMATLVGALQQGVTLDQAAAQALDTDAQLDLGACLGQLMRLRAVVGLHLPDEAFDAAAPDAPQAAAASV